MTGGRADKRTGGQADRRTGGQADGELGTGNWELEEKRTGEQVKG